MLKDTYERKEKVMGFKSYLPLLKLRISCLITFSAIVGAVAGTSHGMSYENLGFLILVTMLASASAGAFNHYFDRDIDCLMGRTKKRPLTSPEFGSPKKALYVAIFLMVASLSISFLTLNFMVTIHLFLGAFVYVMLYTVWLKRRSWANIIIGGLAGSFAVLAGGASAAPELCFAPVVLAVFMFFWTPSHFWAFAIVHKEEYRKAGVPMLPVVVGDKKTALYILLNTILLFISSLIPSYLGYLGAFYLAVAFTTGLYFIFKNVQLLMNPTRELAWANFKVSMFYLAAVFSAVIFDMSL